jgi:hypothetical protein
MKPGALKFGDIVSEVIALNPGWQAIWRLPVQAAVRIERVPGFRRRSRS